MLCVGHRWGGFLPLLFELLQVVLQSVEAVLPELPIRLQPVVQLLERFGPESADAPVGNGFDLDHTRFTQDAEVFGGLGLTHVEAEGDFTDRQGLLDQQFDDVQTVRFGQGVQGRGIDGKAPPFQLLYLW